MLDLYLYGPTTVTDRLVGVQVAGGEGSRPTKPQAPLPRPGTSRQREVQRELDEICKSLAGIGKWKEKSL